jgi:hypothetical protein
MAFLPLSFKSEPQRTVEILLDHLDPYAVLAVMGLGEPCRCPTRVNNAGVWGQNQLNCGQAILWSKERERAAAGKS